MEWMLHFINTGFHHLYGGKNAQNKPKSMPIHEKGKAATPSPITE